MGKFSSDASKLLEFVGGRENIRAVSHCVTRMRFVLGDESKADVDKIETLGSAKGTFTQGGQFQVIIGNDVQEFYNEFIKIAGIEGVSKEQVKSDAKSNQTWLQRLMGNLGEIFAPLIPALICGGLILGFRNVIDSIAMFENGTKTLVQISQFWSGVDSFLWLIGEAVFHFLPVGICWSITKKMGTSQILGIILGITLVSPQLLNAYSVASTAAKDIPVWDFGFAQVQMIGYQAQVIPAMMAGFTLVYLEKFFRKVSPEAISMIIVPFFSLVPAVIVAHTVVGPIGWVIGNFISDVVYGGLTSNFGWLFATLFGFVYAPLVITGLHHKMGDGFAIELTDSDVLAPVSGEIVMTFPTKHAYGLRGNNGVEILIHLGMDTVQLEGKGFESFVKVGEYIKQGDKLAKVDIAYIKEHGKSIVSPVIFTSGEKISILKENCNIKKLETEIIKID